MRLARIRSRTAGAPPLEVPEYEQPRVESHTSLSNSCPESMRAAFDRALGHDDDP